MIVVTGRVTGKETGSAIRGLMVSAFRVGLVEGDRAAPELLLANSRTDAAGFYRLAAEPESHERAPEIRLEVRGPAGSDSPRGPLFQAVQRIASQGNLVFDLRLSEAGLEQTGVLPPLGNGEDLAARAREAASSSQSVERALGAALRDRRGPDAGEEAVHEKEFLPRFLSDAIRVDGMVLGTYRYVVGDGEAQAPGALARTAIRAGVDRIQAEANAVPLAPQPGEPRPARRRTRFFFNQDQLDRLNERTADNNPATPPFLDIGETALFDILGLTEHVTRAGDLLADPPAPAPPDNPANGADPLRPVRVARPRRYSGAAGRAHRE